MKFQLFYNYRLLKEINVKVSKTKLSRQNAFTRRQLFQDRVNQVKGNMKLSSKAGGIAKGAEALGHAVSGLKKFNKGSFKDYVHKKFALFTTLD